jgi:uncharacterized protein with von Willebrand factor type A (vWA) domain
MTDVDRSWPLHNLLAFCRGLRRLGFTLGAEDLARISTALSHLDLADVGAVRDGLRSLLAKSPAQTELFDLAFRQWLLELTGRRDPGMATRTFLASLARRREHAPDILWQGRGDQPGDVGALEVPVHGGASRRELLGTRDFSELTADEEEEVARLGIAVRPPWRTGYRWRPHPRGPRPDLPRTLHHALAHGDVIRIERQARRVKADPVMFLVDVSGSMEPYSRMTLRFVSTLARSRIPLELFVFSTRLARATDALSRSSFRRVLADIAALAPDYASGTRIDDALDRLVRDWRPLLAHAPYVILVSDGFDTGDSARLEQALGRLERLARRVLWWNPVYRAGDEPSTRAGRVLARHIAAPVPAHNWFALVAAWSDLTGPPRWTGAAYRNRRL